MQLLASAELRLRLKQELDSFPGRIQAACGIGLFKLELLRSVPFDKFSTIGPAGDETRSAIRLLFGPIDARLRCGVIGSSANSPATPEAEMSPNPSAHALVEPVAVWQSVTLVCWQPPGGANNMSSSIVLAIAMDARAARQGFSGSARCVSMAF